jgi:hypothetical protein
MSRTIFLFLLFTFNSLFATDYFRHPMQGEPFELWKYEFVLDNGTRVWLTYSNVTLPAVGKKIAAELSLNNFKSANYSVGKQFPVSDWNEDKASGNIVIREGFAMLGFPGTGHRVQFSTGKNQGFFLDLEFSDAAPTGEAMVNSLEGTTVGMVVHIPQGRVKGRLAVGKDTLKLNGKGSLLHTWHPKAATDFAVRSIALFSWGDSPFCGQILQGKNGQLLGHAIALRDGKAITLIPKKMLVEKNSLFIEWTNPEFPSLNLNLQKPFQKYSALSTVDSWIERQAAKVVMGGDRILWRGQATTPFGAMDWVATGFSE